ncbi:MAG: nucleotidyltransferase domain-containing protein [Chloroflexi bacterium]|nr:nucleotidyltransferase domain-containing protein [Chloroflexota bacterium]
MSKLTECASKVVDENPSVKKVLLFGSLARGDYTPHSDADVIVILYEDDRRIVDRIPEFLKAFLPAPVPVDVFPYTEAELDRMLQQGNSFIQRAMREALTLAGNEQA